VSFLTYFGEDVPGLDPPRRIYGRVDQREPPDGSDAERTILIDSIDADWFDAVWRDLDWLGAADVVDEVDRHISVVEASFGGFSGAGPPEQRTTEGEWLTLEFTEGEDVAHYLNLFAAPLMRGVTGWWPVEDAEVRASLERVTGIGDLPEASEDELRGAVGGAAASEAVAVYDVGHGNCNALIDGGRPSLYFDFGGGVLRNRHTFPAALGQFCMGADPVIVLSHWDFDHWSSGQRDVRALDRTWIVPKQKMGPTHTTFLGQIHARGQVLVWPPGLAAVSAGDVTLEQCTGPPGSRNDSGLAMVVDHADGSRMLLPADCGYTHVPSAGGSFASVTVPHHGGRSTFHAVARSDGRGSGRCAYSMGAGNSYKHPLRQVEAAHRAAWATELRTEHRTPAGLGHVHLYWDASDPQADPRCQGARCDLTCQQR
jgi:hypothetical protein